MKDHKVKSWKYPFEKEIREYLLNHYWLDYNTVIILIAPIAWLQFQYYGISHSHQLNSALTFTLIYELIMIKMRN